MTRHKFAVTISAVAATLVVLLLVFVPPAPRQSSPNAPRTFALQDAHGQRVTDATYRGKWVLLFFGYTHCPDICPTTLAGIGDVLARLGPTAESIQPVFITLDPERDTPEIIGAYLENFDHRIVGLTGSLDDIKAVTKSYGVYFAKEQMDGGDYGVAHSTAIYLLDPAGRYVRPFVWDNDADELTAKLREAMTPETKQ